MSALGHKRTFALRKAMSALPPMADICGAKRDVRIGRVAMLRDDGNKVPSLENVRPSTFNFD